MRIARFQSRAILSTHIMNALLGSAIVSMTLALVFYSIGTWGERIEKRLRLWHIVFFLLGLCADSFGTALMTEMNDPVNKDVLQIMYILHHCMNVGCQIWTIKDNYRLGTDIQSKVLAFAFGLSAEIERDLISQRTKQCLARLKADGKHIGRPIGSKNKTSKLSGKEELIKKLLSQNIKKTKIAKMLNVDYSTFYKFLKEKAV